jgi:hypothetical protein
MEKVVEKICLLFWLCEMDIPAEVSYVCVSEKKSVWLDYVERHTNVFC